MKKALRIPVYIMAVFLVTIAAVIYLYLFTTLPESELNHWMSFRAQRAAGYKIRFQRINRDLWNHAVFEGIEIIPEAKAAGPSLNINRAEVKYSMVNLTKGSFSLDLVEIDSFRISLPDLAGEKRQSEKASPLSSPIAISTEKAKINSIEVTLPGKESIYIDSLNFGFALNSEGLKAFCERLSLNWPLRDFEIKEMSGKLVSTPDGYRLDDGHIVTGRSEIYIEGNTGTSLTDMLDLAISCEPINLDDIGSLTGVKISGILDATLGIRGSVGKFGGEADVNGIFMDRPFDDVSFNFLYEDKKLEFDSIDGRVFHAGFSGSGSIDFSTRPEKYEYSGMVEHLDLREISPDLSTDFTGRVELTGQSFAADNFRMRTKCDLHSVSIEDYFFHEASGTIEFDLEQIDFFPDFNLRYKNTYLDATGSLEYKGDIDLSGNVSFEDLTDFTDQIFLRKLGGRGEARFDVSGPTLDFSLEACFESDSCWTYGLEPGTIHIDVDLKSFISHRVGTVTGYWGGGELYSVPTDSGFFETSLSGEMAFLDSVRIFGFDGGLMFKGAYDGTQVPPLFVADTLYGEIFGNYFSSMDPVLIKIYEQETDIENFRLGHRKGTLQLQGIVTDDLDIDLNLAVTDFQIQPIMRQIYPDKEVRGIWSGTASLRGNFEDPVMEFDFGMDSLFVDNIDLGTMKSMASYSQGYLVTDSTELTSKYGSYTFAGKLPVDLSFASVENRFPDQPIDLGLVTQGQRLQLAEIFIDPVESFETQFNFELKLTGTYSDPLLQGTGRLSKGDLKSQYMVNHITEINALVRMENEKVYIDSVSASVVQLEREWEKFWSRLFSKSVKLPKPLITANGTITLLGLNDFLYDLSVTGRNVDFKADAYDIRGIAGFNLKVEGKTPPTVRGNITLSRLEIRDEFENIVGRDYDPTVAAVEDSTMWDLDLNVSALNNIWIKNRDVDGEFKADIRVQRHVGIVGALGTLQAIRGSYNVLGEKPAFQSGTITYPDFATVDPEIDFVVVKRIRPVRGDGVEASSEPFDMEIHITGTLLFPRITVAGFSEDEALRILVESSWAGRTLGSESNSQDYLNSVNALALSLGLDPSIAQGIFEELEISEFEADKGPKFSLAKYISPNLYVGFSQRLRDPESSLRVEYYLNNNFSFKATQGIKGSQSEGISFDLNFNYEY